MHQPRMQNSWTLQGGSGRGPEEAAGEERLRVRVAAGQPEGVPDDALLLHVHQDPLPADGTRVLGRTPAGDPSGTVELNPVSVSCELAETKHTSPAPLRNDERRLYSDG